MAPREALEFGTVGPVDPFSRLSDRQLAVLIVALVAVPGAAGDMEASHRHRLAPGKAAPRSRTWTRRGAAVRPPRSC